MRHALATITNSPYGFGGVSTWVERITRTLPERGWRVTTVTHALDEQHLVDWAGKHPGMVVKPIFGRFARLDEIAPVLDDYLEREKPEVVIVNGSYWMVPVLQRQKRRGNALRLIGVCHADENGYYIPLRFYKDCFDHVIGVSQVCYRKLLALGYPPERTSLLPQGVPCAPQLLERSYVGPLRLVYVGRLVQAQKRILDFVLLIEALYARRVDFRLDFYGAGQEEGILRKQVEAIDGEKRVTFCGWIPAAQVLEGVWPRADIFILLSGYEGLSISMVEAMGQGVVPIVSRVESGVEELIREGRTGYAFPIGDIAACADLIASLEQDRKHLAKMSLEAWSLVRQQFSIDTHSQHLAEIFNATFEKPAQMTAATYMGLTAHPLARLVPGWAIVRARRLLKRGNPINQGYTTFP